MSKIVAFKPEVRHQILVKDPDKIKLFTKTELELCHNLPDDPEDKDELDDFFDIDEREIRFWEKFNYDPRIWNKDNFKFYLPDYEK